MVSAESPGLSIIRRLLCGDTRAEGMRTGKVSLKLEEGSCSKGEERCIRNLICALAACRREKPLAREARRARAGARAQEKPQILVVECSDSRHASKERAL